MTKEINYVMEESEIWKDISGYEGIYQISNLGRVKSLSRYTKNGGGVLCLRKETFLTHSLSAKGYHRVKLYKDDGKIKHTFSIHKLVALSFLDNSHNLPEINHKDGIKDNNRKSNLEWCTRSHNIRETYKLHLRPENTYKGSGNKMAKLTEEQVLQIRERYSKGEIFQTELAKEYHVVHSLIGMIINRKIWNHI
jgi:hypothetical protein